MLENRDQEKIDAMIEELVKDGCPRDIATIGIDLSEKAAVAAFEAMIKVIETAPGESCRRIAHVAALKLLEVNSRVGLRLTVINELINIIKKG